MNKKSYRTNVLITLVIFFLNSPSYSNQSHLQLIDVENPDKNSVFTNWIQEFKHWHEDLIKENDVLQTTVAEYLVKNFVQKSNQSQKKL